MTRRKRIGVFGGTFDPMHNAHLQIARAALDAADLDEVLFVVAARPPHKQDGTVASPHERFAMVEAALKDEPRMRASDIELRRDGPSYTADTLRVLERENPGVDLYLIIGLDSLIDLPKWREPEEILTRAKLLVAPRTGEHWEIPANLEGKYQVLPFEKIDLSSTQVRERLEDDRNIDHLVPPTVAAHIQREGTYHDHADSRPRE